MNLDTIDELEGLASKHLWAFPPYIPYDMSVRWNDDLYDILSVFCKATYRRRISVGISSSVIRTVGSVVDTGGGPNLVNDGVLPPASKEFIKSRKSPLLCTVRS